MARDGARKRKRHQGHSPAPDTKKKARLHNCRKTAPSVHHQTALLHKSVKKAKQFELRKLIRRLKASTVLGQGAEKDKATEVSQQRLQDKYDITKQVSLNVVLQLALAECGLAQEKLIEDRPSEKLKSLSEQHHDGIMLVCSKLLSATCVRQQIEAIQERQLQHRQIADEVSAQQCSKQSTLSDPQEAMHSDRTAGFNVPKGCTDTQETTLGGCADAVEPTVDSRTKQETAGAAAAILSCVRQNEIDSGDLSAAHVGMIPDAIKQETGTGSAMLQPGQHFELQKLKASDDQQTQRGKLASQVSAGAQPCQQREKSGTDTDLQGQVKSKNKKKNRLGQRARQQLGRAKQAENCPKKTFMRASIPELSGRSVQDPGPLRSASASKARPDGTAQAVRLHPSWLAKQKQKEALVQAVPVGSKTVFSDDGQPVASEPAPAAVTGTSGVLSVRCKPQGVQKQTLHPSWLAKKAAASREAQISSRPVATKTVFED